ncbi:hypothetical protein ACH4SP_00255 [Streptomyces sp. NPDC021093]|uniref:hypothetical protein n=1 Tax=Streptomyces sp. NPDC021093 TaxID=3365112 RepID=UPI0037BCAC24
MTAWAARAPSTRVLSAHRASKPSCQEPADWSISATTSRTEPARRAVSATAVGVPPDSAKTPQVASVSAPERRSARTAVAGSRTVRAVRT